MKFNQEKYIKELSSLVANDATNLNENGLSMNVLFLQKRLKILGFEIRLYGQNVNTPVLYAYRESNINSNIGIYSHYDVEHTNKSKWHSIPTDLTLINERLFGRGVADNLGIWLYRLHAIEAILDENLPAIHWVFEGQEELGSPIAHQCFPDLNLPKIDLWFEETGFFDIGTSRQRFLSLNEDDKLFQAKELASSMLSDFKFSTYTENRNLTKFDKCPFLTHLLKNQAYLAIGPNDEYSNIHEPNESLSVPLIEKSFQQFAAILRFYSENN